MTPTADKQDESDIPTVPLFNVLNNSFFILAVKKTELCYKLNDCVYISLPTS